MLTLTNEDVKAFRDLPEEWIVDIVNRLAPIYETAENIYTNYGMASSGSYAKTKKYLSDQVQTGGLSSDEAKVMLQEIMDAATT